MKFNNPNTFIPHQTIFSNHANLLKASFTNTMLRFTHGIQNILIERGIVWLVELLSSSLMLYRHMRLGPLPTDIICSVLKFCFHQRHDRANIDMRSNDIGNLQN